MSKQRLYLLIGYPGAGKTTVSRIISEGTGAVHLMADQERHDRFKNPTHSVEETKELYDSLNQKTDGLLGEGKSVIFDTNFNFYEDRQKLRNIASKHGAETLILWVVVPEELAKDRSVHVSYYRNNYRASLSEDRFNEIVAKLEPPTKNEKVIKIDGTKIDSREVLELVKA